MIRREGHAVMRAYRRFMIFGALTLIGMAATIMVQGGWQAVSAAFAIFNGAGFALTFVALRAASERPRSRRPSWSQPPDRSRRVVIEPGARGASDARADSAEARPSEPRSLTPRPAHTAY
jgi:hypothetical protein